MFLLRMVISSLHPRTFSERTPGAPFGPTTLFYPAYPLYWHRVAYFRYQSDHICPCDTLQMHLRLMICHGGRSPKTISKPDKLTSDFKKFPSNLFDLWKCVQVHREWFQIYHILVRIINDFQFVNLSLPCSQELRGNHWRRRAGSALCSSSTITLSKYSWVWLTFHFFSTPSFLSSLLRAILKKSASKQLG